MALKEVMRYAIELAFDGKDAERDSKKTFDKIEDNAEGSESKFSGIGGKMGKALVAGFGAVGVGALLMKGITQAMDAREGVKRLQGQFAFTADEAKKYGDMAGDLYSDGWGEGVEEVQQVVGLAAKKLGATTEAELSGISEAVLAVSKTWGEDFDAVIRSTDQLIQNGLAPNATAALDLIVTAFQNGGNEAGDLLDTIDEYSQHWSAMGLSGEDALNQIIHGFQNGQRDADKMGDAVKEMRIRVVEDTDAMDEAYDDLGLNADAMRLKFLEGGESARQAFLTVIGALQDVEDPVERHRIAIEVIGTQFEDLGDDALESLGMVSGAMDDATGSAEKLTGIVEATDWEKLQRGIDRGMGDFLENAAGKFNEIVRTLDGGAVGVMQDYTEAMDAGRRAAGEFDMSLLDTAESFGEAREAALEHFLALGLTEGAAADAANVVALDWKKALDDSAAAEQAAKDAALEHTVAQLELAEAAFYGAEGLDESAESLEDVEGAAEDASAEVQTLEDKFVGLLDELSDRSAYNSAVDGFDAVLRSAEAANNTAEMTAREAAAAARAHEEDVARLTRKVIDYGDEVGNIPASAVSEITALIDEGAFEEAERRLALLERARVVNIRVQEAGGVVIPNISSGKQVSARDRADGVRAMGAAGAVINSPTTALIGEAGREALIPLDKLPGNAPIDSILGGGNQPVFKVTINAGFGADAPGIERAVVEVLRRYSRRNGPGWVPS